MERERASRSINLSKDAEASRAVWRLAAEHPEWLPVLEAVVAVAEKAEAYGGEFAGSWVVDELARRDLPAWIPNLRILVRYGLLEKSGPSTRGGRRAYYRMPDRATVAETVKAWRDGVGGQQARSLRFIAAGASTEPPGDMARQAGEISYEPRSWR